MPLATATRLHKTIKQNFGTLVFCRRYLDRLGLERYLAGVSLPLLLSNGIILTCIKLNCLVSNGVLESYAPLVDIKGSYSAQFEHVGLILLNGANVLANIRRRFYYVSQTRRLLAGAMTINIDSRHQCTGDST